MVISPDTGKACFKTYLAVRSVLTGEGTRGDTVVVSACFGEKESLEAAIDNYIFGVSACWEGDFVDYTHFTVEFSLEGAQLRWFDLTLADTKVLLCSS